MKMYPEINGLNLSECRAELARELEMLERKSVNGPERTLLQHRIYRLRDRIRWLTEVRKADREFLRAFTPNKHGEYA